MITIPVSIGELIDKLSILQVKKTKITNLRKLEFVDKEFELLYNMSSVYLDIPQIEDLYHKLVGTNSELWDIEDKLRVLESISEWKDEFIELARKVYFTNDERFFLKNEINKITNSEIREVKEYVEYK